MGNNPREGLGCKRSGTTVQFGRVHGICVEKNAELPEGHPNRKFKGRVVFLGNRVVNQDYESATFADLGNAPANLESGRLADCYGAVPGHGSEVADAVQAYLQSLMLGDPCWVELAAESRPGNILGPQQYNKKDIDKLTKCGHNFGNQLFSLSRHCVVTPIV